MANFLQDTFTTGGRGTPNAWSPSSSGSWAWNHVAGTATMAYSGGQNEGTLTGDTSTNMLTLGTNLYYYANVVATCTKNSSVASIAGVVARVVNANTYYAATYTSGVLSVIAVVAGVGVTLGTYSFTETAGTDYSVRLQVSGQNSNIVKAKIWSGGSEPTSYQITSSADNHITLAGGCGVYGKGNSSGEVLDFTGFLAGDPSSYSNQLGNSPYGINLQNNPGTAQPGPQMLRDAVNAGYTWVRWQFTTWAQVEPTKGTFNWTQMDAAVQACNAVGMNVLLTIRAGAPWATINPCGIQKSAMMDPNELLHFLTDANGLLYHYNLGSAGTIQAIDIGNEDYEQGGSCASGTLSATLMKTVYPAIKALVPGMIVGGPAEYMGPKITQTWWTDFFAGGGGANIDFINIHSYPCVGGPGPNDVNTKTGQTVTQALQQVQQVALDNGYGNLPIWMTENSWAPTNSQCLTPPPYQSLYYQQILDDFRALYPLVQKHFWYDIGNLTVNSNTSEHYRQAYTMFQGYNQQYPTWSGGGGGGSAYKTTVLADNPQGYYRLDEQVGVTAGDSSGHSYNGTYSSTGVAYGQAGLISGDPDTAVLFDGLSGQVTIPNGVYTKGWTAVSLEVWFELPSLSFTANAPLYANGVVTLTVGAGGANLIFTINSASSSQTLTATYSFLANTRYYVCATYDGTTMALYINPASSTPTTTTTFSGAVGTPSSLLTIGGNAGTGNNFPGTLDEAAIYKNVALSGTRVLAHYDAGASGTNPPPVFGLVPTTLNPQSPGVTKVGTTYTATVSLSVSIASSGTANWTASSSLSGVTFTPASGALTPGASVLITISGIPALNGTFTFSGAEGETPVTTTWTLSQVAQVGGFALFANGSGVASFDHFRVTGYPDPALALLQCGRAGASVANFNANLPNAQTTAAMNTSLDGVNWSPVAYPGNPIVGITAQPALFGDIFSVDSSANYTQTFETGGSASTWTWDTANSRVVATGGVNGLLIATALTGVGDMSLFVDSDYMDGGGCVWCYTDAGDLYALLVHDAASTSSNPNTIALIKVSGGSITQLVTNTAITFNRNTYHRILVTMVGKVITVLFDGTQVFTYTDASPLAAGQIGLRNTVSGGNSTARYYQLSCQPQGQLFSSMDSYVYSQLALATTDPLNSPQILDSATLVTGPSIGMGATIPGIAYQNTFVSSNYDDLRTQSDYFWQATPGKQVIFTPRNATPAPWILQASDPANSNIQVSGLGVEYSGDLYRNRQTLTNVQATLPVAQPFLGNGKATSWTLPFPVAVGTVPTMTVNGSPVTVGILGQLLPAQYYYTPGGTGVSQDASQSALDGLQTLLVSYTGIYTTSITVDNAVTGTYPGTIAQDAYALLQAGVGGTVATSGIVEHVLDMSQNDNTKYMDVDTATQYGQQLLQEYGVIGRTVTFKTIKSGLAPGQALAVFIPQYGINNAQMLVTQADISVQNSGSGLLYWWNVIAVEGPSLGNWVRLIGSAFM